MSGAVSGIEGKVIVVTGAASGLGFADARLLAVTGGSFSYQPPLHHNQLLRGRLPERGEDRVTSSVQKAVSSPSQCVLWR